MGLNWAAIFPDPCRDCHLRPCGRVEECPKRRKNIKLREQAKAAEQQERDRSQFIHMVKRNGLREYRRDKDRARIT